MRELKIGELAERTGTNAPTIRYYEDIALLPRADRARGGQRRYSDADVKRLTIIRTCREFGFSIERIRLLLAIHDSDRSCAEASDVAREHLFEVRAKLRTLKALEKEIEGLVRRSETGCKGPARDCVMLEDLARTARPKFAARHAGRER
jgi:DNA-binding transcriptional MerR regulator